MAISWGTSASSAPSSTSTGTSTGINWGGSTPAPTQPSQQTSALNQGGPSLADTIWQQIVSGVGKIGAGIDEAKPIGGTGGVGGLVEGVGKILGGAANVVTSPLSPLNPAINAGLNAVTQPLQNNPAVQKFALSPAGETTSRVASTVADYANAAGVVAGGVKAPEVATDAANAVKSAVTDTPEQAAARATAQTAAKQASDAKQVSSIATEWQRPVDTNIPGFNKARDVIAKAPETPTFLAQQGIDPRALIQDGRYSTEEAAQALRDTAGKLSQDTLRPSLQAADYATAKTAPTELLGAASKRASTEFGVTPADAEGIQKIITDEVGALQRKYPEGMTLTQMHDEGINFNQNGGFKPFASAADTNKAIASRAMGTVLRDTVDAKAPASIPVTDFKSYLSKYYKAADFLDALNTKKAPATIGQSIARGAAKYVGAAVGEHLTGGVVSAFAGYSIGKAIEHALENLSARSRATFIHNLEITNPEAFTKVQEYLHTQSTGGGNVPRLPAGSFIAPPAPSEATQMTGRALQLPK